MFETINQRRRFLGIAVMTLAATKLATIGSAVAQSSQIDSVNTTPIKVGTNPRYRCHPRLNFNGGINITLLLIAVERVTTTIGTTLPSSSGSLLRLSGNSMTRRSIAVQHPSTIPITSAL